jgi:hypothetical protein
LHDTLNGRGLGDIALDRQHGTLRRLLYFLRRRLQHIGPPGHNDHARAFFGHAMGSSLANAFTPTGDDGHLIPQS